MRIGIYVDVAKDKHPRGVGYHILQLLKELSALDSQNEYLLYYQCNLFQGKDIFSHCPDQANFQPRPVRTPKNWHTDHPTLWWKYLLPRAIRRDGVDVFHGPSHFIPALPHLRTAVTIHDVAFMKMDLYESGISASLRKWCRNALDWAGRVIALSENTKRDLESLGVESERIRVIYGGGNILPESQIQRQRCDEVRSKYRLPDKYILFVGVLHPRKNVPFLLRSFARLKQEHGVPHGLVVVGKRLSAGDEIDALIKELGISQDVTITGYVDDWEIPLFYEMADVFVLPTLYEGFTLVTLEAMAYGTPVISTDCSSIREGTGHAAILVEVNNVAALTEQIHRVLTHDELRRQLVARGKEQAGKFTWQRCARETLAVYQELSGKPDSRQRKPLLASK